LKISLRLFDGTWAERVTRPALAIGLTTFGTLALELALIRWTSAQVRIFAYFNNVVLISAFLGIGLGVALGRRRPGLIHLVLPTLLVLALPLAFSESLGIVSMRFPDQSIMLWGGQELPANPWVFGHHIGVFLGLLALIVVVFVGCGAALGCLFGRMTTLRSYQADLAGSLLGVLAFTAVAWLDAGPPVWFALGCVPFVLLARELVSMVATGAILWLAQYSVHGAFYSPYNRIDLSLHPNAGIELRVNRDFHQYMFNLSDASVESTQVSGEDKIVRRATRDLYDLPFTLNPHHDTALIVGAGTGNDVQAALRNGYTHVTSVDIDGRIISLGRQLHPEAPYANPAVEPVVDDARAYFEKNRERKFDLVCFGLLDSHAMSSAMSTLRLDNYVYTEEGIRAAWQRVGPGGHLSLTISCFAGRWFYERLHWTIERATGRESTDYFSPTHSGTVTFIVGRKDAQLKRRRDAFTLERGLVTPDHPRESTLTTSDDWPFLYLRPGAIPWGYFVVLGSILILAAVSVRKVFGFGSGGSALHWPLFFMGAAFLLIETRGVTSLSLLFGSTWVVNSAVFAGILVMVLIANAAVNRWRWNNPRPWFFALFAAVVLLYVFPLGWLHTLPLLGRGIIGGLLTGLPIGLAGVIVPMLLTRAPDPAAALGANLLGAVLGGCLEYFSMFVGLRATALLALVLYLAAYFALGRLRRAEASGLPAIGGLEPARAN
jgi:hypothetical protein